MPVSGNQEKEPASLTEVIHENHLHVHLDIHVVSLLLFFIGKISFRAVPRILDCFGHHFGINVGSCHFTSVILWALRLSKYRLDQISPCGDRFSLIIDSSIRWGKTKVTAALRVASQVLEERKGALSLQDVEVVGLWIHEDSTGEIIAHFLEELFSKTGTPFQILSDSGSDLLKGIRILPSLSSSPSPLIHTLDIGHFSANLLKKKYQKDSQFQAFLSFTSSLSSQLRQTLLSWIVPNKLRTKGRFQGISELAKWACQSFEFIRNHLASCSEEEQLLLKKNFQGSLFLLPFAQEFHHETSLLNQIQKLLKNEGLTLDSYHQSMILLAQLKQNSEVREGMENYLSQNKAILEEKKLSSLILSTDVIESLFGKLKYLYEHAPVKDINRLALLLPVLAKEPGIEEIMASQREVKVTEEKEWEKTFFSTTRRQEKRKHFDRVNMDIDESKTCGIIEEEAA